MLVALMVKNLSAVQETRLQLVGWKDPPGGGSGNHSSILAWEISWTEKTGELQFMGLQRVGYN